MPPDEFHTVNHTLTSLMNEPFLSDATSVAEKLIQQRMPHIHSFAPQSNPEPERKDLDERTLKGSSVEVDLFAMSMDFVGEIASTALMGSSFMNNNPGILQDMWTFDSGFNALLGGIPVVTPGLAKATAARSRLKTAVEEWNVALTKTMIEEEVDDKWRDMSDVSATMKLRSEAFRKTDADERFQATQQLSVFWGLQVNANKVVFWMLLNIVSSPDTLAQIRDELAPYAKMAEGELKLDINSIISNCPFFKTSFYETMRLYTAGLSYKKVLQDLTLTESAEDAALFGKKRPQTYHIAAGTYLAIPHQAIQTNARLWLNPTAFDPGRYLVQDEKDPEKTRADMGRLNPFGGGSSICKGRYFAEREVMLFVAGFLTAWDFEPVGAEWKLPKDSLTGTGSANPKERTIVRMTRRGLS